MRTSSCEGRIFRTGYTPRARAVHVSPARDAAGCSCFRTIAHSGSSAAWLASRGRCACEPLAAASCRSARHTVHKLQSSYRIACRGSRNQPSSRRKTGQLVSRCGAVAVNLLSSADPQTRSSHFVHTCGVLAEFASTCKAGRNDRTATRLALCLPVLWAQKYSEPQSSLAWPAW